MSRFRTSTHRQQVCHELQLPDVLRRRRESVVRVAKQGRRGPKRATFTDLPEARPIRSVPKLSPVPAAPVEPTSDPTRQAIDILERRLLKLAGALRSQESLLLEMRQAPVEDTGLASTFRRDQKPSGTEPGSVRKMELMERIFKSNQELRERITSPQNLAE